MGLPRNRGENSEILGGGVGPKCSGFLVKSTFQTPLGDLSRISDFYHFLKRSVYGNKTHPRPECVMGKLFCFRWFKTEKSKRESFGGIKEGSEWPKASAPSVLPEKRETHTCHTIVSLWGNSVWSHCQENICHNLFLQFFFTYKSLNYKGTEWSIPNRLAQAFEHLQTWNIICYIKYIKCETTTDDVNSGPWFPNCQTGWNGIYSIQVKFI